jgi:hypothetical protein
MKSLRVWMKILGMLFGVLLAICMTFGIALADDIDDPAPPPTLTEWPGPFQSPSWQDTVDNGDGTYTFSQVVNHQSTPPHYTGPWYLGGWYGFGYYSWYDQDYGWQHDFPDYSQPDLLILQATLTIRAWDVDSETSHGWDGEYDGVTGDGVWLNPQYLQGTNNTWSVTVFNVDPNTLMDGLLNLWLNIDMHHNQDWWATTLDYSRLDIDYTYSTNNSPYQPELAISPVGCTATSDNLVVNVTGPTPADPDGDAVMYEYRWLVDTGTGFYVDDEFAGRGDHTGNTVPAADTQTGDRWMVEVIAVDAYGAKSSASEIEFATIVASCNTPPELTLDTDPVEVDEGQTAYNDGMVTDAEGDTVALTASAGTVTNNGDGTWSWSFQADDGPADSQTVWIYADDSNGGTAEISFDLTVNNVAPTATFNVPASVDEGSDFSLSLTAAYDPSTADMSSLQYAFDCGDGSGYGSYGPSNTASCPTTDGPESRAVMGKIQDKDGGVTEYGATVPVNNVPPTLGELTPDPLDPVVAVGTDVSFDANFTDPAGAADEDYTCTFDWKGDGTVIENVLTSYGACQASHAYSDAGIYTVKLTVTDKDGGVSNESTYQYVVVYDPSAGFVTGGGWIDSPEGAYKLDLSLTGRANFGFVSKYKKGANTPTGNTEFQFHAADLNFHSSTYEWLVVTGSDYAMFKGVGTINGTGEYKFMIWAGDDEPDTFRIKIWYEENGTEIVVYDNGMDQAIGGGSIVIHTK